MQSIDFYLLLVTFPQIRNEDVSLHKSLYNAYYNRTQVEAKRLNIRISMPAPFPGVSANFNTCFERTDMTVKYLPEDYYKTLPSPEGFLDDDDIEGKAAEIAASIKKQNSDQNAMTKNIDVEEDLRQMQDSFKMLLEQHKPHLKRIGITPGKTKYCEDLFKRVFINSEGDVTPCCFPNRPVLGNVNRNAVREIWNGDLYNDFRRNFLSSNPPDCCKDCAKRVSVPKQMFLMKFHKK